jgi:protoporphyrin/coproporphyrin ferrochelatase
LAQPYDAVLVVSFGGPEGPADVLPFLQNVLRGKNVPHARMLEVARHYERFGGVSPLNAQNRQLVAALGDVLSARGPRLPIYWGNRNWHPLLADTLAEMAKHGIRRALGFFTSAYSSYSGCRQYREDIERAQQQVGPAAPEVDKLRAFFNHPGFIEPMIDRVRAAIEQIPPPRRAHAKVIYTAHSIPLTMADRCRYAAQLAEAARLVSAGLGLPDCRIAYQSRSGPPDQPWLAPDILETIRELHAKSTTSDIVIAPIGFLSDHIEILYDLDIEARDLCSELGINMVRAATVGSHPQFVEMIRELIEERLGAAPPRWLGTFGPSHDVCPADCCLPGPTRAR